MLFIYLVNSQATAIVQYCTAGAPMHCVPQFTPQMEIHLAFLSFFLSITMCYDIPLKHCFQTTW